MASQFSTAADFEITAGFELCFESWAYYGKTYKQHYSNTRSFIEELKQKPITFAVLITMYNENEEFFKITLKSIFENLRQQSNGDLQKDEVLVIVICDGYEKISSSFQAFVIGKHLFDPAVLNDRGLMENGSLSPIHEILHNDHIPHKNLLHLFSRQISSNEYFDDLPEVNCNFIFGLKHVNKGTLNSLLMFLRIVCGEINPQFVINIDIGTKLSPLSFQHFA